MYRSKSGRRWGQGEILCRWGLGKGCGFLFPLLGRGGRKLGDRSRSSISTRSRCSYECFFLLFLGRRCDRRDRGSATPSGSYAGGLWVGFFLFLEGVVRL